MKRAEKSSLKLEIRKIRSGVRAGLDDFGNCTCPSSGQGNGTSFGDTKIDKKTPVPVPPSRLG